MDQQRTTSDRSRCGVLTVIPACSLCSDHCERLQAIDCMSNHPHSPAEEWRIREAALDETIAGSFPASDPPSSIPNPDHHDAAIETLTPSADGPVADTEHRSTGHRNQEPQALTPDFEKWILAIVSHDIRDPLGTILFAAKRLQDIHPDGPAKKHADVVERGVHRIQHIVGDLLDLAREQEGSGIPIEPKPTDLRSVCRQILDELEAIAYGRQITFECDVDGTGVWDEHRILQAISNLASNAVRHGTPGSKVRLRLTGDEQQVAVEVHNRGTIPSNLLPCIFEPFGSGRRSTSRGDGLGLGLFIAKAIARAHRGGLEVDSSDDATVFRLVLPRHTPIGPAHF